MCRSWRSSSGSCAAIWPDAVPIYTGERTPPDAQSIGPDRLPIPERIALTRGQPTPIRRYCAAFRLPPLAPSMRRLMDELDERLGWRHPQLQSTGCVRSATCTPTGRPATRCVRVERLGSPADQRRRCRPRVDRLFCTDGRRRPDAPSLETGRASRPRTSGRMKRRGYACDAPLNASICRRHRSARRLSGSPAGPAPFDPRRSSGLRIQPNVIRQAASWTIGL